MELWCELRAWYESRCYHADTKTGNLLIRHPEDESKREYLWVDLDVAKIGRSPGLRGILRNLVQLNGSVDRRLSREERLVFLDRVIRWYPYLAGDWIPRIIESRTRRRLENERDTRCGP